MAAMWHLALGFAAVFLTDWLLSLFQLPASYGRAVAASPGGLCGALALGCILAILSPRSATTLTAILLTVHLLIASSWLIAVARGALPPRTFPAVLLNNLVWMFPLLFVLLRGRRLAPAIIAGIGVVVHILACVGLLSVSGGTEIVDDMRQRAAWVAGHPALWSATWMVWVLASMSLFAFTIVWAARLLEVGSAPRWVRTGCGMIGIGVLFDLVGESINLVGSTLPQLTVAQFAGYARTYALLSAGTANGLYCIGGLLLSVLAWRIGWLRGWVGLMGLVMWTVGLGLTAMVVADNGPGMIATGAAVMVLYIPWSALVGWRLTRAKPEPKL
jgi:hypothetical protein